MTHKPKTFARAIRTPRDGWGHTADREHLTAAAADLLARRMCLNPKAVYDWAIRHGVDLKANFSYFADPGDFTSLPLVSAVLNDWSLEETRRRFPEKGETPCG